MRSMLAVFLILAACDRGPPIPTAAENRDLDEADNLLDAAENDLDAIDTGELERSQPAP